jgi:hypothetical protein
MRKPKPAHNIAKVTHISGRSANISPTRLRVEEFLAENCEAYTSKSLGNALAITTHNASRILREMHRASTVMRAGSDPNSKPRWAHRDHVRLHTFNGKERPEPGRSTPQHPRAQATASNITPPRVYTNSTMPNGDPEYWARMMAWGR